MLVINNIRFYTVAFVYLVTQASVLKRAFDMCFIKIVQSVDSSVSRVSRLQFAYQIESWSVPKQTSVAIFALYKLSYQLNLISGNSNMKWRTVWAYFCAINAH